LAAEEPERWQRIDATQTKDAVQEDVHKIVLEFLGE
jgi:thymidylate kinase